MGNGSSTTKEKNSKTAPKSSIKKITVSDSVRPKYQPSDVNDGRNNDSVTQSKSNVLKKPVPSSHRPPRSNSPRIRQSSPVMLDQQPSSVVNKERSSPVISTKPVTLVPTTDQSFSVLGPKPSSTVRKPIALVPSTDQSFSVLGPKLSSPVPLKERVSPPMHRSTLLNTTNIIVPASSFKRAPMVQLNYVGRSSDNKPIHTYGADKITVMHRTSLGLGSISNRQHWYDYDYDNNTKPLVG